MIKDMKKKKFFKCICLNKDPQVLHLDYSSRYLRQVPLEIFNHERTLESLNLDNNNIAELSKELFCCKILKELILSDNELTNIPDAIGSLSNLCSLNISKNNLQELPDKLGNCDQLTFLDCSGNMFDRLPEGLCQMAMLQELIANTAFLTELPQNIGRLTNLYHLEVRENDIKRLPDNFSSLCNLHYLDVGHNDLKELPDSLCLMSQLSVLSADKNDLTSLPEKIGLCSNLTVLELQNNRISSLPDSLCQCVQLTELICSGNMLKALPLSFGQLPKLTNLRLDSNLLTCLPESVGQLQSLTQLYLSFNHIVHLPPSIGLLRRLRYLHVDMNCITDLPVQIGSCMSLSVLSLRGNRIQYLPDEIGRLPKLRIINLSNNRVKFLPISFLKLRELRALWLNDNQTRPLVQLQSERDVDTGRKCLVCYLLPQMSNTDDPNAVDNDPIAWQMAQENRPRVVQWNDEATENSANSKGKLPKDAPAKQVNLGKLNLVKHIKTTTVGCSLSQAVTLGNGDSILISATSSLPSNLEIGSDCVNHSLTCQEWNASRDQNPLSSEESEMVCQELAKSTAQSRSFDIRPCRAGKGGTRIIGVGGRGSGYESDSAALQDSRNRIDSMVFFTTKTDGVLEQTHESCYNEPGSGMRSNNSNGVNMENVQGLLVSNDANGGGCGANQGSLMPHEIGGKGVHGTGRITMANNHQSGYNTDSGLLLGSVKENRLNHHNRVRSSQKSQVHFKNPYEQLRIMRSSAPAFCQTEIGSSTNAQNLQQPLHTVASTTSYMQQIPTAASFVFTSPSVSASSQRPFHTLTNFQSPPLFPANITDSPWPIQVASNSYEQSKQQRLPSSYNVFHHVPYSLTDDLKIQNTIISPPICCATPNVFNHNQAYDHHHHQHHQHHTSKKPVHLNSNSTSNSFPIVPSSQMTVLPLCLGSASNINCYPPVFSSAPLPFPVCGPYPSMCLTSPTIVDKTFIAGDTPSSPSSSSNPLYLTKTDKSLLTTTQLSITIQRNKDLGFSITGGITSNPNPFRASDKGIFIVKVNPCGPADGLLKVGDKILTVNNTSFIGIEHSTAVSNLKSCGEYVQLLVDRLVGEV